MILNFLLDVNPYPFGCKECDFFFKINKCAYICAKKFSIHINIIVSNEKNCNRYFCIIYYGKCL